MKKIGLIAIVILLAANVCACSRKDEPAPTNPQSSTQPAATVPATRPEMDPTLDTNIPDPTVNENSQGMGEMNEGSTGSTNGSGNGSNNSSTTGTENSDIGTDNNQNGLDNSSRNRMFRK